jgi:hypothetical protein
MAIGSSSRVDDEALGRRMDRADLSFGPAVAASLSPLDHARNVLVDRRAEGQ